MSFIYNRIPVFILLNILLTGCSNMQINTPLFPDKSPPHVNDKIQLNGKIQLNSLMLDYAHVQNMHASELDTIFEAAQEKFLNEKKDEDRIRYILLLSLPNTSFHNRDAALTLLKEWHDIEQYASFISFRNMLITRLEEEERINKMANDLSQQLVREKQQTEILQRKVNGIKDMEKTLIRRNIP